MSKKLLSPEEFEKLAYQYALENSDTDNSYKWMKTKQTNDFNFDHYLKISKTAQKTKNITRKDLKEIHKTYRLYNFFVMDSIIYAIMTPKDPKSGLLDIEIEKQL
jgi:hypothetical protein